MYSINYHGWNSNYTDDIWNVRRFVFNRKREEVYGK